MNNNPFYWTEANRLINEKIFGRINLRLCYDKSQSKWEDTVIIILTVHKDSLLTFMQSRGKWGNVGQFLVWIFLRAQYYMS